MTGRDPGADGPAPGPGGDGRSSAIRFGLLLSLTLGSALATGEPLRTSGGMLGTAGAFTALLGLWSRTSSRVRNFTYWDEAALLAGLGAVAPLVDCLVPGLRL